MPVSGCPFSRAGITDPGYSSSVPDFHLDKPARSQGHFTSMKTTIRLFFPVLFSFFLAVAPYAQAVIPPPDGGYPGFNTAEGQNALLHLTTGTANTAVGWLSLENVTTASFNTGVGAGTLVLNSGDQNTATGAAALLLNTTGNFNTATGSLALLSNTTGNFNTAIGDSALEHNTTGDFNTALGENAGINVITASNVIAIGNVGADVSNTCYIGNIFGVTSAGATAVYVNSLGKLGTVVSSRQFKDEIKAMDKASEAILALKPVTFHYKSDATSTPQFGLIAEEVAEVNPDLVVRDADGELYTVRYEAVNAMLLNEFLKEHREVAELKSTVAEQRKGMEAMAAQLKEQAAQIRKVSAQLAAASPSLGGLEVSKFATGRIRGGGPAPQIVNNP